MVRVSIELVMINIRLRGILATVLLTLISVSFAVSGEEWQTDYEMALKQAKTEHKKIFLNFTGSDWCVRCMSLKRRVFHQPKFMQFANQHLVLVEVDFPRNKPLQRITQMQNEQLRRKYHVKAFPTLVLLDCYGSKLGERIGYMEESVEEIVQWINMLISGGKN